MTQKTWDDIDLAGLTMQGPGEGAESDGGENKREQERIDLENLKKLVFDLGDSIPVTIDNHSANMVLEGAVKDVSPLGIQVAASGEITENDIVHLGFSIGKRRMSMKGEVRWVDDQGADKIFGIRFINPQERDVEFVTSIFTAMYLR